MIITRKFISSTFVISCLFTTPVMAASTTENSVSEPIKQVSEPIKQSADSNAESSGFSGWWSSWKADVADTWNTPDSHDIYLPAITWHNRLMYDKEKTDKYNERPWGAGYGISRYDENGDWHGIYLMAFKDSHNKWEPIGGYGYEKIWQPLNDKEFRLGLGYTAAVTARDDYKYIPIPIVLPLASVGYSRLTFQATYIPGTYNNGNVFFAWLRYQF